MSGGGSRGNNVGMGIPAGTKKMMQSIKEIVNCTEQEIYAALKDCDMDPNEAISRLICQDTFHEVKSKREKKKEAKETPESRSQRVTSGSSQSVRAATDRGGRNISTQITPNDNGTRKLSHKNENGGNAHATSSVVANNSSRTMSAPLSYADSLGNTIQSTGPDDGISWPLQPPPTFQHNWSGTRGHLSLADIVKMGKPQGKPSVAPAVATGGSQSYSTQNAAMSKALLDSADHFPPPEINQRFHSSHEDISKIVVSSHEPTFSQHEFMGEWSLVDQPPLESGHIVSETSGPPSTFSDTTATSTVHVDGADLHLECHINDIQVLEGNANDERTPEDFVRSASISHREVHLDNHNLDSCVDDQSLKNTASYQSSTYEHHKVENIKDELSSASANLQQLNLHSEQSGKSTMGNPAVIIPDHLQFTNADCSHLSFGSFGSGISDSFSGTSTSKPLQSNLDIPSFGDTLSSVDQSDVRESKYYDNKQLQPTSDDEVSRTTGINTENFDVASASQPEVSRDHILDSTDRLQHNIPSISDYAFSSATQPDATTYINAQSKPELQNLAHFSSLLQQQSNSLPSSLLTSAAQQPFRDFDLPFLPLLSTHSAPAKYNIAMSSISGPAMLMPQVLEPAVVSTPQPTQQILPSSSVSTIPALPQHLSVHPYSQPALPLGHFANMIGYPYLPQGFAYMPSAAFQQPFSGNSAFHQSPALNNAGFKYALPQFKNSISVNSLPQSAVGYEGFGSSVNISQNSTTVSASTSVAYEDPLGSQYKNGNHFVSLHQNENSPMWLHEASSRIPASTYYGLQGQNQQSGVRQSQQPSPFRSLGYPTLYPSQSGVSQEHQPHLSEGNLNGSHGATSRQSHQIWQQSY